MGEYNASLLESEDRLLHNINMIGTIISFIVLLYYRMIALFVEYSSSLVFCSVLTASEAHGHRGTLHEANSPVSVLGRARQEQGFGRRKCGLIIEV